MTISRPKALLNTQPSHKNKTATSERKQNPYFFLSETKKNILIEENIQEKEKIQKKEKKPREG